jgi:hypothetical protein
MNAPTFRALRQRATRTDPEAGSATVFVAITVLGLLILCGLVVDGGAKLRAVQRADHVAAEAARAAGQAVDPAALAAGDARVDRQAAVDAANGFLAAAQATGAASISADGTTIVVTVTSTAPTVFLDLIGVSEFTVTGHGTAVLVHAVTGGGP